MMLGRGPWNLKALGVQGYLLDEAEGRLLDRFEWNPLRGSADRFVAHKDAFRNPALGESLVAHAKHGRLVREGL